MALQVKAVAGNTAPAYLVTLERDDGSLIDLTNCTVSMKLYKGSTQTNTGHESSAIAVQSPASAGVITWQPKTGDLPSPGSYKGDVYITYSDTTVEVLYNNFLLKVRKLLGT